MEKRTCPSYGWEESVHSPVFLNKSLFALNSGHQITVECEVGHYILGSISMTDCRIAPKPTPSPNSVSVTDTAVSPKLTPTPHVVPVFGMAATVTPIPVEHTVTSVSNGPQQPLFQRQIILMGKPRNHRQLILIEIALFL